MKNFINFKAEKYNRVEFKEIEKDIYLILKENDDEDNIFVTSLSFELEIDCYGKNENTKEDNIIPEIPFECLLDNFNLWVSDFYDELENKEKNKIYIEFASDNLENIIKLREIIGKRAYVIDKGKYYDFIIE